MRKNSLLAAIGNTPLVPVALHASAPTYAKLEYLNPGGSVKDRSALFMIEEAERTGQLQPGFTIIDASSGNQGISTAMIGAIKGYKVIMCVSEKISEEKKGAMKALGAHLVVCPSTPTLDDPENYYQQAVRLHHSTPNSFMPNQYFSQINPQAHYTLFGPEIWEQTEGKITHFVAGTGTCGTITGVGRYLKERNPTIQIIGADAATSFYSTDGCPKPYKVEGIGIDWNSPILDRTIVDHIVPVHDEDAIAMLKTLSRHHGFLVGPSSGAVAYVAQQWASKLKSTDLLVMVFGDSGRAYLTKGFYD